MVDLVNNLEKLAEDQGEVMKNILSKANALDEKKLKQSVSDYGNAKAKRLLAPLMH